MLEAHGVVVAPSLERLDLGESDRLTGSGTPRGNLFALDIDTSCDALQVEAEMATVTLRGQRCVVFAYAPGTPWGSGPTCDCLASLGACGGAHAFAPTVEAELSVPWPGQLDSNPQGMTALLSSRSQHAAPDAARVDPA